MHIIFPSYDNQIQKSSSRLEKTQLQYNHSNLYLDFEYKIESLVNGEEILLQLTSFSEDAYHYFNSMERNRGSFFGPFGTEPSPIFSNIENGIGIFASGRTIFQKVLP